MSALCATIAEMLVEQPVLPGGDTLAESAQAATMALDCGQARCADPFLAVRLAARGDLEAMRHLADEAIRRVLAGLDLYPLVTLHEGAMFARMAAEVSNDPHDHLIVVFLLSLAAGQVEPDEAVEYAGECIARLELAADLGGEVGEEAARILTQCASGERQQTIEIGKTYRARIVAAREG